MHQRQQLVQLEEYQKSRLINNWCQLPDPRIRRCPQQSSLLSSMESPLQPSQRANTLKPRQNTNQKEKVI